MLRQSHIWFLVKQQQSSFLPYEYRSVYFLFLSQQEIIPKNIYVQKESFVFVHLKTKTFKLTVFKNIHIPVLDSVLP